MTRHLGKLFAAPMVILGVLFALLTIALAVTLWGIPAALVTGAGAWICFASAKVCWNVEV